VCECDVCQCIDTQTRLLKHESEVDLNNDKDVKENMTC